jgi:hypothetical protein
MSDFILSQETTKHLLIAEGMAKLRKEIGILVCKMLKINNEKVCKYFNRAFVRWVFNAVSKGKNPFLQPLDHKDFVCLEDLEYLSEREKISFASIDWTWLSSKFKDIHLIEDLPDIKFKVCKDVDNVYFSCTWKCGGKKEFKMPMRQYYRSKFLYSRSENVDVCLMLLLARYKACGSTNNHSSVPPAVIKFTEAKTELFGSPLNTSTEQYCSPFPELESSFGSMGSFFSFKFTSGVYFVNPPFDEELMTKASLRIVEVLSSKMAITVIVVLPAWDVKSQNEFHGKVFTSKEYEALKIFNESGFLRSSEILRYQHHKFYDYYSGEYRALANCHLMVLSNTIFKITAYDISTFWKSLKMT